MIVDQIGYFKIEDVQSLIEDQKQFSIYKTFKKTHVLILDTDREEIRMSYPKKDRLPWKVLEGKSITNCEKVFDSSTNFFDEIDLSKWNNSDQIMAYKEYESNY